MLAIGCALAGLCLFTAAANADDADLHNPGYDRPGLGFTPAALEPGAVTLEQGLPDWTRARQDGSASSLYTVDSLLRLGLGHQLELQVGDSFYNRLRVTGGTPGYASEGRGDSTLALKYVLPSSNPKFSWGLLGSVEFTDGQRDFRNSQKQYLLGLQLNLQVDEKNSLGAYLQDLRAGDSDSQIFAVSDNYQFSSTWTAYVEAALEHDAGNRGGALAGTGVAWQITKRVQLDGGVRHRLGGEVNEWEAGVGVSIYFGK